MTKALPRQSGFERPRRPVYRVHRERSIRAIADALAGDCAYAAYALGHLEPGLFERAEFWIAEGPPGSGLVMHSSAMGNTMVVAGDPGAVGAVLSLHPGPRRAYLSTASPEHLPALRATYHLDDALSMARMTVTLPQFRPVGAGMQRLRGRDAGRINRLYATEGGPSHYAADTIERAVYYGAFDGSRLISVAGTHIVAPNQGIGIVGNVFTRREYRGHGFATRVTSAVTAELFRRGCTEVTLTVDPQNTPAVRAYSRLGYRPGAPVVEARLRRRATLDIGSALRRRRSRRHARDTYGDIEDIEIVYGHEA